MADPKVSITAQLDRLAAAGEAGRAELAATITRLETLVLMLVRSMTALTLAMTETVEAAAGEEEDGDPGPLPTFDKDRVERGLGPGAPLAPAGLG